MSEKSPFLVLGIAVKYSTLLNDITPERLSVFVRSFHEHSNCAIVLFTRNLSRETMAWLRANGVQTVDLGEKDMLPANYRFIAARAYLSSRFEYSHIFLSDVLDVVAQGDIFASLENLPGLHVFLEHKRLIRDCPYNSGWVLDGYGRHIAEQYADKRISCVGTVFGDRLSMLCYLSALNAQLLLSTPDGRPRLPLFGMDTAAHAYLLHSGELARHLERLGRPLTIHENGRYVLTAGCCPTIGMTTGGSILSPEGDAAEVVHQYNRFPQIDQRLKEMYPA